MNSPVNPLKKFLNIIVSLLLIVFLALLLLETATLIYVAPTVNDSIVTPEIGTGSDIILSEYQVTDPSGNPVFKISPDINGTGYLVGGKYIFVPSRPLSSGTEYHITYGEGSTSKFRAVSDLFDAEIVNTQGNVILVSFSQNVSHSDAESLISFEIPTAYDVNWYGNTMAITFTNTSVYMQNSFSMKGNISIESGGTQKIDLSAHYHGGVFSGVSQIPSMPVTVVYVMLPPGLIVGIATIDGAAFQGYFIFIFIAILASVGYTFYQDRGRFIRRLKSDIDRKSLKLPSDSPILEAGLLLMATLFFSTISYLIADFLNQNPVIPQMGNEPVWFTAYSLARAGVWEEIVTRIPFIGIPLLFTHLFMKKKKMQPVWRYILGGKLELDWPALIFLFTSSLFFGLAHAFAGWDIFKVLPAMVGGLAMGYLFLKWGLHAAILFHFANDYLLMSGDVFSSKGLDIVSQFLLLAMVIIGAYIFYLYSIRFIRTFIFPQTISASEAPAMHGRDSMYGPANAYAYHQNQYYNQPQYPPQYPPYVQQQYPPQHAYPQYPPQYPPPQQPYPYQQPVSLDISPTGYIRYRSEGSSLPIAPYPFRCIRCGGTIAMFKDDGKVVCTTCGMEYTLKKESPGTAGAEDDGKEKRD